MQPEQVSAPEHAPAPPSADARARRPGPMAFVLLLAWITMAGAAFLLMPEPPPPPSVSPEEQAIRERMGNWAVRDAEEWGTERGDLTLPWNEAQGHLAIVIDDVGRELDLFEKLHALRFRLSFSVLPGAVYAEGVQQRLSEDQRRPREILLHLPMEPLDPDAMEIPEEGSETFLLASDTSEELRNKLEAAMKLVPLATGVNNHMGSRLTADRKAMTALMPILRKQGWFFLDSRTNPKTVAASRAKLAGVETISRKVFLDHEPGRDAIRASLAEAVSYSRDAPTVAIAHPSMEVVEVLREELPRLHAQGVAIYSVSELLAFRYPERSRP